MFYKWWKRDSNPGNMNPQAHTLKFYLEWPLPVDILWYICFLAFFFHLVIINGYLIIVSFNCYIVFFFTDQICLSNSLLLEICFYFFTATKYVIPSFFFILFHIKNNTRFTAFFPSPPCFYYTKSFQIFAQISVPQWWLPI